jgi:hypothetical protein
MILFEIIPSFVAFLLQALIVWLRQQPLVSSIRYGLPSSRGDTSRQEDRRRHRATYQAFLLRRRSPMLPPTSFNASANGLTVVLIFTYH